MDKGLETKPADIVRDMNFTQKAVYNHISSLKEHNIITVVRENLKCIKDIQVNPSAFENLRNQSLKFLFQDKVRQEVQRVIESYDSKKKKKRSKLEIVQ